MTTQHNSAARLGVGHGRLIVVYCLMGQKIEQLPSIPNNFFFFLLHGLVSVDKVEWAFPFLFL